MADQHPPARETGPLSPAGSAIGSVTSTVSMVFTQMTHVSHAGIRLDFVITDRPWVFLKEVNKTYKGCHFWFSCSQDIGFSVHLLVVDKCLQVEELGAFAVALTCSPESGLPSFA